MGLSTTSDRLATEGFEMGLVARVRLRALRWLGMASVLMVCVMSAAAEPPEKPIPKALPVADDEPQTTRNQDPNAFLPFTRHVRTTPLTKMMEEADKELAETDKNRLPNGAKKEETPLTRYYKQVIAQVEKKWHIYLHLRREGMTAGELQLVFYVNLKGKVEGLKVGNDKKSTLVLTEVSKRAIMDAEIPPIPADVIPLLPEEDPKRLKMEFNVVVYDDKPAAGKTPEKPKAAVKEDNTPRGRYTRLVLAQVEKKWKEYRQQRAADVRAGSLTVEFYVNKLGRVEGVHATDLQQSYALLTGFTLRAVKDAEIPPMPVDVISLLPKDDPERLKIEYHVLVY